jgi:hypothetical protein
LFLVRRFLSPWWRRRQVPPKRRFLQEPHGVTTQKTPFFMVTAVKTTRLTSAFCIIRPSIKAEAGLRSTLCCKKILKVSASGTEASFGTLKSILIAYCYYRQLKFRYIYLIMLPQINIRIRSPHAPCECICKKRYKLRLIRIKPFEQFLVCRLF